MRQPSLKELAAAVTEQNNRATQAAVLAQRIRGMAMRWGFAPDELAQELARAEADPAMAASWVERDERNFGHCVTGEDFAEAYRRARGLE